MIGHKTIRLIAAFSASLLLGGPAIADSVEFSTTPIEASLKTFGQLEFRGGLRIVSTEKHFGGFSGLLVDGDKLVAVTDKGRLLKARLTFANDGQLTGLVDGDLSRLFNARGVPLKKKKDSDSEALARGEDGETLIAFERDHRIQQYPPDYPMPDIIATPFALTNGPKNGGIEALARLKDGRLVIIAEGPKGRQLNTKGWVYENEVWMPFRYALNDRFRPTGATPLADGSLVVLERFRNKENDLAARLRQIPALDMAAGATVHGTLLAELRRPALPLANFEGVAATTNANGETLLYLISDNNFGSRSETLLLLFAMKADK